MQETTHIDRRVVKTKRAIKEAFAKLLTQKDINDITISDIAAEANINRKTTVALIKSGLYDDAELDDWYDDLLSETYANMKIF